MKSFRSIFLISILVLSISVGVFANSNNIKWTTDDTHAHWPNEGLSADRHELYADENWVVIVPNLDTECSSHKDYVGFNQEEDGCVDADYGIHSEMTSYVDCRIDGKKLECRGMAVGTGKIVNLKGYPNGDNSWVGYTADRWAYENFHFDIIAVPTPNANSTTISAVSSGPSKTALASCSGGTGDYIFSITDTPNEGSATISPASGLITYVPAANSAGNYDLTYQCKDENDKTDTALVTIIVTSPTDTAPIWSDIPQSKRVLNEDAAKATMFKFYDYCSDLDEAGKGTKRTFKVMSYTPTNIVNCWAAATEANAGLVCEPKDDQHGTTVVNVQCKDPGGQTVTKDIDIIVNPIYDPIELSATQITVKEDTPTEGSILLYIPESGDSTEVKNYEWTFSSKSAATAGTLNYKTDKNSKYFTYTPKSNFVGTDSWNVVANQIDESGRPMSGPLILISSGKYEPEWGTQTKTLTFHIANEEDIPSTRDEVRTIDEDGRLIFNPSNFYFEDQDISDSLKEILITPSTDMKGELSVLGNTLAIGTERKISKSGINNLIFEPAPNEYGENSYASFSFKVVDQSGNPSESKTYSIKVNPVQDEPTFFISTDKQTINEDSNISIEYITEDLDGETMGISASSSNEDLVLSSSLSPTLGDLTITPIANAFGITTITIYLTDGTDTISTSFELEVKSVNDIPESAELSKSIYEYGSHVFTSEDFAFTDLDNGDELQKIKIMTLPNGGKLKLNGNAYTQEDLETQITIFASQIPNLAFESEYGFVNTTSFSFKVEDGTEFSQAYLFSIAVQPSPYGPNSHPSSFGGYPIQDTGWACKPGYTLDESALTAAFNLDEICITKENELPVPNIVAPTLVQIGDTVSFSGASSIDPEGAPIASYSWEVAPTVTKSGVRTDHVYTNVTDCPLSMCTINLTVTDDEGASASITHSLTLTELEVEEIDYTGLRIILDKTYTDGELAYLALLKGGTILADDKMITVDAEGKVISIEPRYTENTDSEPQLSYVPYDGICQQGEELSNTPLDCLKNDGYCSKSQGENQINSPDDCDEGSILGILGIFAFITIIGGGTFFAWKKGLLGSHNMNIGAKPTSTGPSEFNAAPKPAGPETYIKTQRSKGFSNEQIRGALKNKGWDDDKIDEALNSSRE